MVSVFKFVKLDASHLLCRLTLHLVKKCTLNTRLVAVSLTQTIVELSSTRFGLMPKVSYFFCYWLIDRFFCYLIESLIIQLLFGSLKPLFTMSTLGRMVHTVYDSMQKSVKLHGRYGCP